MQLHRLATGCRVLRKQRRMAIVHSRAHCCFHPLQAEPRTSASSQPCSPLASCSAGNTTYQRISGSLLEGTDDEERDARPMGIKETLWWFASWMIPGMGMFLEVRAWQPCTVPRAAHTADLLPLQSQQSGVRQAPRQHATAGIALLVWSLAPSAFLPQSQAYYIFSIGNIKPLLKAEYPDCYKDFKTCGKTLTQVCDCPELSCVVLVLLPRSTNFMHAFCATF